MEDYTKGYFLGITLVSIVVIIQSIIYNYNNIVYTILLMYIGAISGTIIRHLLSDR